MKRRQALRLVVALAGLSATASFASGVSAQSAASLDGITAEALFDEGVRLMGAEDYASACPKLQRSYDLDPGIGTLLYLGDCYRSVGKTASAWMAFRTAAFQAAEAGQREREQAATGFADALHAKLVILRLQVVSPVPGAQVKFDGNTLPTEILDVPFAVDPGKHAVELSAPGHEPQHKEIDLEDKPGIVEIGLPPLEPSAPPPVKREVAPQKPMPSPSTTPPRDSLAWLLVGAGASAVAIGGGLAAFADDKRTGLGLVAGGVLSAGVGGLLLFRDSSGKLQIGLAAGPRSGGLVAARAF